MTPISQGSFSHLAELYIRLLISTLTTMIVRAAGAENFGRLMSIVGTAIVFGTMAVQLQAADYRASDLSLAFH